jgi:hypothetical protein
LELVIGSSCLSSISKLSLQVVMCLRGRVLHSVASLRLSVSKYELIRKIEGTMYSEPLILTNES